MDNPFTQVNESQIVSRVKKGLEKHYGGVWYKIHGGPYQEAGIPDIIGCLNGHFIGFEVKRPEKRKNTSEQQKYQIKRLGEAGACVSVITSLQEAIDFLEAYRGVFW